MRLTLSIWLWLAGATSLVLGFHGWFQLERERADLETAARREIGLLARAVRVGVETGMRDGQRPDISSLLHQLELGDPALDLFVFDDQGTLWGSSLGSEVNQERAARFFDQTKDLKSIFLEKFNGRYFVASAPLNLGEEVRGRVVLIRPGELVLMDLAQERESLLLSMVFTLAALLVTLGLVVHVKLHRPLQQIVRSVRKIAAGDLNVRFEHRAADEIAELGREVNGMALALSRAKEREAVEQEMRDGLTRQLQAANRLALVGQLAAGLAHEIGSPLQVLNGRSRALTGRADLPADARRSAEILVEQSERIVKIVEDLLQVARRKSLAQRVLRLSEPVGRVVELIAYEAKRRNVKLRFEAEEELSVFGDADRIEQVALNLLQNAIEACEPGGEISVRICEYASRAVAVGGLKRAVMLQVQDDGVGMSEELKGEVFKPLFSAWLARKGHLGTGMGLVVVESIVREHGGEIEVNSRPGEGAEFRVYFPWIESVSLEHPMGVEQGAQP